MFFYLTRGFIASTLAFNLLTRVFNLPTRAFNLAIRACSLLTRGLELVTRVFELVARGFEPVTRKFELVTRISELVTRVLLFHLITGYHLVNLIIFLPTAKFAKNYSAQIGEEYHKLKVMQKGMVIQLIQKSI